MTKAFLYLGLFLFSCTIALAQGRDGFPVQTKIKNGTIEGLYDTKTGIQKYFGIPFAKPPIGELRWKAPQAVDNWSGVKETKEFGPRPIQRLVFGDMNSRSNGVSEDCLYLNVWTPASRNTENLPVLVYFFGGGFVAGDGSEPRYDGENMAKEGIVVVTINYRLGIFGFLAHPELSAEAPYKASGNYGLLDQTLALQWVQENIAAFGGDPKKVTIAGESAGSISVSYQMASPLSKNLIAAAIGESGAGITALAPTPLKEAEQVGVEFLEKFGIKSIVEARKLPTRDLYEMYNESGRFGFPVVQDGYLIPKSLTDIFNAKEQAQVPLLLGWNTQENPGMAFMQGLPYTKENFITKVKQAYPNDFEEVLKLYAHETDEQVAYSAMDLAGDRFISYSTWKWFDLHRKNSDQPVYRYLYAKLRPPLVDQSLETGLAGGTSRRTENTPPRPKDLGAPHAAEIEYAMGNLDRIKEFAWTADDYKASETMFKYFANFIKTHNPNGEGLPEWSKATANEENPPVMVIDTASKEIKAQNDARYKFHDRFYGNNK
ncbi:carboxylesterase/lipase family protein [Fontibacter flavus]|uniref:Carboxylic ester hydrolase n=1 Tax=Fontibacter flavus TaxID=654838 RepID=A0ABV6FX71_9BACT